MTKIEKMSFVQDLIKYVENDMLEDLDKVPENWDGTELRLWVKERFSRVVWRSVDKKTIQKFNNDVIINNI